METLKKKDVLINFFVKQTVDNYGLDYDIVQDIYDKHFIEGTFYEKLEEYIK